ncbi:MAG: TetR family transcriptional regulator [Actinomycetota bacterium]|nr:TetR family transcriptional regulator [Actinomycetota bacterium]
MGTTDTPGRRERKKLETRRALESAAIALFSEQGFDDTTVEEICDVVDVSTRTFNRYFPRKEDVLFADHEERVELFRSALAASDPAAGVLDAIKTATLAVLREHRRAGDLDLRRALVLAANPLLQAYNLGRQEDWIEEIASFVAERLGVDRHSDPRPELMGRVAIAAIVTARRRWMKAPDEHELADEYAAVFPLLATGFGVGAVPAEP